MGDAGRGPGRGPSPTPDPCPRRGEGKGHTAVRRPAPRATLAPLQRDRRDRRAECDAVDQTPAAGGPAEPLVLALDVGTSSTRAMLFDRAGQGIDDVEARRPYKLRTTPDGGVEGDPGTLLAVAV